MFTALMMKVESATFLERFITNMQRERSEVAFHIFTNGTLTLGLNLTERFKITDEGNLSTNMILKSRF